MFFETVEDLGGVFGVVKMGDAIEGHALNPRPKSREICPGEGQGGEGDVCVLGHLMFDNRV
jgi:hypothetical protein